MSLIGRKVITEYRGGDGRIVDVVSNGRIFAVEFTDYTYSNGLPISVDFRRGEFSLPPRC